MSDPQTTDGATPKAPKITLARLGVIKGKAKEPKEWVDVHFNPASLQLQINTATQQPQNEPRKQYTPRFTSKLTMDLPFDTTDSGNDVTITTRKLQAFVAPPAPPGKPKGGSAPPQPPRVMFQWGLLKFQGIVESYKETLDFFSAGGVPLRASVNMTLTQQDRVFDDAASKPGAAAPDPDATLDTPATNAADAANDSEAPGAARTVAQANGQENLRFGDGSPLSVTPSVTLKPPAAFSSAPAGGDLGLGINASAGAAAGISGLSRLSATEGAFAGLQASASAGAATVRLDTSSLMPQTPSAGVAADGNASFKVGGRAMSQGGAGLRADVGAGADARARLTFD